MLFKNLNNSYLIFNFMDTDVTPMTSHLIPLTIIMDFLILKTYEKRWEKLYPTKKIRRINNI
jgi:hypothetical protein